MECFLGVFAPPEGFPPKPNIKDKLERITADLSLVRTQLSYINGSGNGDAHEHVVQVPSQDKFKVVDAIFILCSFLRRHFETTWPADAARALEWMANPRVYQLRTEPSHNDRVTEVQLWLADVGLSDCRASFAGNGIIDVETLLLIKNEGEAGLAECLTLLNLPFGFRIKFKNKLAEVTPATVADYQGALRDIVEAARQRPIEEARRRQEAQALLEASRAAEAARAQESQRAAQEQKRREDERLWAVRDRHRKGELQLAVTDLGKDYKPRGWYNAMSQWLEHGAVDYGRWVGVEPHCYWSVAVAGMGSEFSAEGEFSQPIVSSLQDVSVAALERQQQIWGKYRRSYIEAHIAANRAKVAPKGTSKTIFAAAQKGDAVELLKLVEPWFAHPVLNDYSDGSGNWTPLMIASYCGRIECVRVLVAQPGIEINKGSREHQETALYWASLYGHVDIVELLCSLPGIDCNKANTVGNNPHSHACVGYSGSDKEDKTRKMRAILAAKGAK